MPVSAVSRVMLFLQVCLSSIILVFASIFRSVQRFFPIWLAYLSVLERGPFQLLLTVLLVVPTLVSIFILTNCPIIEIITLSMAARFRNGCALCPRGLSRG